MRKSNQISSKVTDLKLETSKLFDTLVKEHMVFNFAKQVSDLDGASLSELVQDLKESDGLELLPLIEIRNDITGHVFDVYVIYVSEFGVRTLEMEDKTPNIYKFSDLLGIEDQLILLNEMEEYLVESN